MVSRIFLIGFMGCGKSTIGKELAHRLGYTFLDLDHIIEHENRMPITEIFGKYGEHGFRERERQALHSLHTKENIVIATGGGAPCFYDNISWMNSQGETVFLDCTVDVLVNRLKTEQDHRPLIKGFNEEGLKNFISKKLDERMPFYSKASIHLFCADDVENMVSWLEQTLRGK